MEQKAKIIGAVIVGVGGYFGIKYLTKNKGEEDQPAFMGGSGNSSNTDAYVETQPNTVYNVNVESPTAPTDYFQATAVAPTKKEATSSSSRSSGSSYYSTNFDTQSTNKAVDFSKTSATSNDRFASNSDGATIDRYRQQSISPQEATKRATQTKKESNFLSAPNQSFSPSAGLKTPTKKETKKTDAPAPKKKKWYNPRTWGN